MKYLLFLLLPVLFLQAQELPQLGTPPKPAEVYRLIAQCHEQNNAHDALQPLYNLTCKTMGTPNSRIPHNSLKLLLALSDAIHALRQLDTHPLETPCPSKFAKWLWESPERTALFLDNFDREKDDYAQVLKLLETLYRHDKSQERNAMFPLMLALSLVWDTPRSRMHAQVSMENLPPFTADIEKRYDYYFKVYTRHKGTIPLQRLSVPALCFVVDAPVPVSELVWSTQNVKGTKFDKIFNSIKYDNNRLANGVMVWPFGTYSLSNIQKRGGICVDQAYFTTIAAKAKGIPAIYFSGEGKRGGHAWVAVMKSTGGWETDIGRYRDDDYTTGQAIMPQTGVPVNDHLLSLVCARIQRNNAASQSDAFTRLAEVLAALSHHKGAEEAAVQAIALNPVNLQSWDLRIFLQKDFPDKQLAVLDDMAEAFAKFPDYVLVVRRQQAKILRDHGKDADADKLLAQTNRTLKNRDDLESLAKQKRLDDAMENGNVVKARLDFESHLKNSKSDGAKILDDIQKYLDFTQQTRQTEEAVKFLTSFVRAVDRRSGKLIRQFPGCANWDKDILIKAHLNNHDEKSAEKIRRNKEK